MSLRTGLIQHQPGSICLLVLSVAFTLSSNVVAQPVEQEFDGISFIKIEANSFTFGSPSDQQYRRRNEKLRAIPLDHTFWISTYEVTQGQWMEVMGSNPSTFKQPGPDMSAPVETITWYQAKEFISRMNTQAGGNYYRLPTEAEWEYIAKAGTSTSWPFGDQVQQLGVYTHRDGLYRPRYRGLKSPNPWGVYDLYGNVYLPRV